MNVSTVRTHQVNGLHDRKALLETLSGTAQNIVRGYINNRGVPQDRINEYLRPEAKDLNLSLPQLRGVVGSMLDAINIRKRILIFGDYDCDGICATAVMLGFFRDCTGLVPAWELPIRQSDQYGLTTDKAIELLCKHRPEVLIVLDSGTNAGEALEVLHENGVRTVVIDHHPCETAGPGPEPQAISSEHTLICNPKLAPDSTAEANDLCTAGLVFLICDEVARVLGCEPSWDREFAIALAGMATVADVCDLSLPNRALVKCGIGYLNTKELLSRHVGLNALIREVGFRELGQSALRFQIIPRVNALGWVGSPAPAVELLLSKDASKAAQIASLASGTNRQAGNTGEDCFIRTDPICGANP